MSKIRKKYRIIIKKIVISFKKMERCYRERLNYFI